MEKNKYSGVRLSDDINDVVIIIKETFKVHLSPAFSWKGKVAVCTNNELHCSQLLRIHGKNSFNNLLPKSISALYFLLMLRI